MSADLIFKMKLEGNITPELKKINKEFVEAKNRASGFASEVTKFSNQKQGILSGAIKTDIVALDKLQSELIEAKKRYAQMGAGNLKNKLKLDIDNISKRLLAEYNHELQRLKERHRGASQEADIHSSKMRILANHTEITRKKTESFIATMKRKIATMRQSSAVSDRVATSHTNIANNIVRHIRKVESLVVAYYALSRGYDSIIGKGIEFNKEMEAMQIKFQGIIVATTKNELLNGKDIGIIEKLKIAKDEALNLSKALKEVNLETPHGLIDTGKIMAAIMPQVQASGAGYEKLLKLTKLTSIAMEAGNVSMREGIVAIDNMISGDLKVGELKNAFKNFKVDWDYVKSLNGSAEAVDYLIEKLGVLEPMADVIKNKWENLQKAFENSLNAIRGEGTEDLFKIYKDGYRSITEHLTIYKDHYRNMLQEAITGTINAFKWIQDVGGDAYYTLKVLGKEAWDGFKNGANFGLDLIRVFFPEFMTGTISVRDAMHSLLETVRENKVLIGALIASFTAFSAGSAIFGAITSLTGGFSALKIGILGVVGAITYLTNGNLSLYFEATKQYLQEHKQDWIDTYNKVVEVATNVFNSGVSAITTFVTGMWDIISPVAIRIGTVLSDVFTFVAEIATNVYEWMSEKANEWGIDTTGIARNMGLGIALVFDGLKVAWWGTVYGMSAMLSTFADGAGKSWVWIQNAFGRMADWIGSTWHKVMQKLGGWVNDLVNLSIKGANALGANIQKTDFGKIGEYKSTFKEAHYEANKFFNTDYSKNKLKSSADDLKATFNDLINPKTKDKSSNGLMGGFMDKINAIKANLKSQTSSWTEILSKRKEIAKIDKENYQANRKPFKLPESVLAPQDKPKEDKDKPKSGHSRNQKAPREAERLAKKAQREAERLAKQEQRKAEALAKKKEQYLKSFNDRYNQSTKSRYEYELQKARDLFKKDMLMDADKAKAQELLNKKIEKLEKNRTKSLGGIIGKSFYDHFLKHTSLGEELGIKIAKGFSTSVGSLFSSFAKSGDLNKSISDFGKNLYGQGKNMLKNSGDPTATAIGYSLDVAEGLIASLGSQFKELEVNMNKDNKGLIFTLETSLDKSMPYYQTMTNHLANIDNNILSLAKVSTTSSGMGNFIGKTGDPMGDLAKTGSALLTGGLSLIPGVSRQSQSVENEGIKFETQTLKNFLENLDAENYRYERTKKRFLGVKYSDKGKTKESDLTLAQTKAWQDAMKPMVSSFEESARMLGLNTDISNISLSGAILDTKGLKTDEIEALYKAQFGKWSEELARGVLGNTDKYRSGNEQGGLDTTARVATQFKDAETMLSDLGVEIVKFTEVTNKATGKFGLEAMRDSLLLAQGEMTGIGKWVDTFQGTASEFATSYKKIVDFQSAMRVFGNRTSEFTQDMIKGAGSIDNLTKGLDDYYANFFTKQEQSTIALAKMNEEFNVMGLQLPKTKNAFRELVESYRDVDPEKYAKLLTKSSSVAEYYKDIEDKEKALTKERLDGIEKVRDIIFGASAISENFKREYAKAIYNTSMIDNDKELSLEYGSKLMDYNAKTTFGKDAYLDNISIANNLQYKYGDGVNVQKVEDKETQKMLKELLQENKIMKQELKNSREYMEKIDRKLGRGRDINGVQEVKVVNG
jgi:hypothetical protein